MATENKVLVVSIVAAEDLTADQYRFMIPSASGVRRPNSSIEVPLGILQNAPAIGEAAQVMVIGQSKFEAGEALGVAAFVMHEYVSATDAGKGVSAVGNLDRARGIVMEAADAEGDLGSLLLLGPVPGITATAWQRFTVTTDATAGARTYTAAELIGGLLLRDPAGGNRSDVTPTAALIVAGIAGCVVGSGFEFVIKNTADADETLTLTGGATVTMSGAVKIGYGQSRRFLAIVTNATPAAEAVTIYGYPDDQDARHLATVLTDATAGAKTYTAGNLIGGLILRDPAGADRSDVTPIAADIVAGIHGCAVGSSFTFEIRNTADALEVITLTAGDGNVTLSGAMTIGYASSRRFLCRVTNASSGTEAVTIYSLPDNQDAWHLAAVLSDATAGAKTYTAAHLIGGLILRDPAGASRSDVFPIASAIVAAIRGCVVGSAIEFTIRNTADADETLTLTAPDATITLSGAMTIGYGASRRFLARVTDAGSGTEAVTIYSLAGTNVPWKLGNVASAADALAIPVTHRHVSKTTGADAEALTLANGVAGQRVTITLVADGGGDGTLTPATKTGFATIVFADAGDSACLEYVDDTVGWVLVGTAGVAAPPVITV